MNQKLWNAHDTLQTLEKNKILLQKKIEYNLNSHTKSSIIGQWLYLN